MATKKEIFESALVICKEERVSEKGVARLTELLAPKSAGAKVDLSTVTKVENGKVTQIQCQLSKVWLPATIAFFYEEKAEGKGIKGTDGKMLRRLSRQAESISKAFKKTNTATIQAIMEDIMDNVEDVNKVKALKVKLEAAKAAKPNYSTVTANPVKTAE